MAILLYLIARILRSICRKLPLSASYGFASFAAEVTYLLWRRGRANLNTNTARVLGPQASRRQIAYYSRLCMRNYLRYVVDFLRCLPSKPEEMGRKLNVDGAENLDEALKEGKGAVIVSLHFGHWDFGAMEIALRGYSVNSVVDDICRPMAGSFVNGTRTMTGVKIIAARDGIRQMLIQLRKNELVAMLIDKPNYGRRIKVHWRGSSITVPAGAAVLALRTGAKLIPSGAVRLPDNTIRIILGKPISPKRTGDFARDIDVLMENVWHELEELVKEYPEQLYIFHSL